MLEFRLRIWVILSIIPASSSGAREAIDHFIYAYNAQTAPFEWRQDEFKQQPMRDNISYFCR
jgi:hypothetical protein